ncbi:MAG: 30S ribosomal protein S3 [Bacteroidota bacterium]
MGQKVNTIAFRLGTIRGWESNWYANKKDFAKKFHEDIIIRSFINKQAPQRIISKIVIERTLQVITITIHTARPGILIGPNGSKVQELKQAIKKKLGKEVRLNIYEVKNEDMDAILVAKNIAAQLEARASYKRVAMRTVENIARQGIGIQVRLAGRLGGAEIARKEEYKKRRIPRHTLRADIDFGMAEAVTTYGKIGIKVWLYKTDVYGKRDLSLNVPFTKHAKRKPKR